MWRLNSSKIQQLRLPVLTASNLKIAELSGRTTFAGAQAFPAARWNELKLFGANVLAGSASELQRLTERIDLRTLQIAPIDHAVFVLTELGDKPLTDSMRVVLWQRFGVPVYEVYLGPERQFLARECEALEGWHVEPGIQFIMQAGQLALQTAAGPIPTGLTHKLHTGTCACGRPGMRIVSGDAPAANDVPFLAATA